ncbi:hypothetical protein B9W14_14260 [Clostridium drakei]|uniref:Uncharacterized protein n=1 Tax=Clostridium drakei TaxID=332101 RepID=A0A2U8DS94_9CLOT|nr:hypothetical protein B9W14_14260 [Clostridium drakei]
MVKTIITFLYYRIKENSPIKKLLYGLVCVKILFFNFIYMKLKAKKFNVNKYICHILLYIFINMKYFLIY